MSRDWQAAIAALQGVYAPRTLENCLGVFLEFERWCQGQGRAAVPVEPDVLAQYVAAIFGRVAASTIRTRLIEIRRVHEAMGFEDPTQARAVRLAYRRGARTHGTAVRQAYGLNAPLRDRLLAHCGEDPLGLRDTVMIALGYDILARASELIALRVEDLRLQRDGTAYILVRSSKTDPAREPKPAYMSAPTLEAVLRWLDFIAAADGPLLRPIQNGLVIARPISTQTISHRLRELARAADFDEQFIERLTSHSFRVGAAQDLASSGRTLLEIMLAGRWRDVSSVADYTRDAQVNVWAPGDGDIWAHLSGIEARVRKAEGQEPLARRPAPYALRL